MNDMDKVYADIYFSLQIAQTHPDADIKALTNKIITDDLELVRQATLKEVGEWLGRNPHLLSILELEVLRQGKMPARVKGKDVRPREGGPYSLYCYTCGEWVPNTANAEMRKEGYFAHSHICKMKEMDKW